MRLAAQERPNPQSTLTTVPLGLYRYKTTDWSVSYLILA